MRAPAQWEIWCGGMTTRCLLPSAIGRCAGAATLHPASRMHAVSRRTAGKRHALIICSGRNARIVACNREGKRRLQKGDAAPPATAANAAPESAAPAEAAAGTEPVQLQ